MAGDAERIDVDLVSRNQLEPMFAIATDGTIAFCNARFAGIVQRSRDEIVGSNYALFDQIVESGFEAFRAAAEAVLAGESAEERVELSMRHGEGAPVPRRLDAEARVTPLTSGANLIGVLVTLRRIDTRKEQEQRLTRQNERLEEFAGVVSHDLRNPLNVAEGHLQLARAECESDHLDAVADALDRMGTIIESTLTLAKQGQYVGETEPMALADVAKQCWPSVGSADASLEAVDDLSIVADPDRLRNLLENLFRNSVEHAEDPVTVRVGAIDHTGFYVEDDGPGIPPANREQVFDLGFSTTEDGTGYGLAIVRWIAEAHGWEVSVTGATDGGTRFEFTGVEVL